MEALMFEWIPIESKAMKAIGFDPQVDTIYVRFNDDKEWWYSACPPSVWEEFIAPGQSKGIFLNKVLRTKPSGRYNG
jgi:hypothetical protein